MSELTREQVLMATIAGKGPPYLRGVDLSALDLSRAGWLVKADLRQANLTSSNLARVNLSGALLEKANMHSCNLAGADLQHADMREVKLDVANLRLANLAGAVLKGASLVGTNLVKVNLECADLEKADLEGANLSGANLKNAKLNLANLKMANFSGADLAGASLLGTDLDLARNLSQLPVPAHGFAGAIRSIQLTDLIQLVCLANSTLLIRVESSLGTGMIHVKGGRVCHAEQGDIHGERALMEMLQWNNGRFETFPLSLEGQASIHKPLEHLLLESMRRKDEKLSEENRQCHSDLLKQIRSHTPIPAYPSKDLVKMISGRGRNLSANTELQISDAFDSDESGNILCSIVGEDGIFIAPLSHLTIKEDHPLFQQVAAYQGVHGTCHG
ncbi:MAG: DUF4388 domain-containing protein [Deltaproteobacteria bacterium]|nr:DUF4388 domain-containing protein [Deltaproteobacteria bacterium]